jgi:uncharacterized membrane protein
MTILILGTLIFLSLHLIPSFKVFHATLVAQMGAQNYRGFHVTGSVAGMMMIIIGKSYAGYVPLWTPPLETSYIAAVIMLPACILFVAMAAPTNIKRYTRHPMLWGVALWAIAHCLTNGDLASIICFGGFGAYALRSMWSLNQRGAALSTTISSPTNDVLVIIAGLIAYGALIFLHPYVFGVTPLPELAFALQVLGN